MQNTRNLTPQELSKINIELLRLEEGHKGNNCDHYYIKMYINSFGI